MTRAEAFSAVFMSSADLGKSANAAYDSGDEELALVYAEELADRAMYSGTPEEIALAKKYMAMIKSGLKT